MAITKAGLGAVSVVYSVSFKQYQSSNRSLTYHKAHKHGASQNRPAL